MAVRKIKNMWYSYFRDENGVLRTRSTGCTDRDQAEKIDSQYRSTVGMRRQYKKILKNADPDFVRKAEEIMKMESHPQVQRVAHKRGTLALSEMLEKARIKRSLSEDHERAWKYFCKGVDVRFADEVTPAICQKYLDAQFGDKSAKTWNNNKSALNMIFRLCLVEANITMSPFQPIMNKELTDVKSHRNLTDAEIALVLEKGDLQIRIMTMLARWTAQRLETCSRMTWNDFDFEKKIFLIKPGKTSRFNKFVCVPLFSPLERFLKELEPQVKDKSAPLVNVFGWTNNDAFSRKFARLLNRVNIQDSPEGTATFHSIRGTAITWMKDMGLSADIRRAITGHSNLTTEDIYARSIKGVSDAAKAINKCM